MFGAHRITDLGDGRSVGVGEIDHLKIGNSICSIIDVVQNEDNWDANSRRPIQCQSDINQNAGEYNFEELVRPGIARHSLRTQQTSLFTGQNYTQRVLSQITSLSSHQGGTKGHRLTVKGTGLSKNVTDYSCTIAG